MRVPGIVVSASVLQSRAVSLHIICRSCRSAKNIPVGAGFGSVQLPRKCDSTPAQGQAKDCPLDPFVIVHDKCTYIDIQTVKLQEAPDMVPVGELPRHMILNIDRYLTGKVIPGSRVIATGIYSTFQSANKVRQSHNLYTPRAETSKEQGGASSATHAISACRRSGVAVSP